MVAEGPRPAPHGARGWGRGSWAGKSAGGNRPGALSMSDGSPAGVGFSAGPASNSVPVRRRILPARSRIQCRPGAGFSAGPPPDPGRLEAASSPQVSPGREARARSRRPAARRQGGKAAISSVAECRARPEPMRCRIEARPDAVELGDGGVSSRSRGFQVVPNELPGARRRRPRPAPDAAPAIRSNASRYLLDVRLMISAGSVGAGGVLPGRESPA